VVVPEEGAAIPTGGEGLPDGPIGLGTATVEQLETIDGIGPVTAEKIVEFRDQRGGLASVEQLDEVSGIGPATMESLRDSLQP
jgi:competence protein ComEA